MLYLMHNFEKTLTIYALTNWHGDNWPPHSEDIECCVGQAIRTYFLRPCTIHTTTETEWSLSEAECLLSDI